MTVHSGRGVTRRPRRAGGCGNVTPELDVENLSVHFSHRDGAIAAVREASLSVLPAECVGIVGESGSGKTQTFMAVMGLLSAGACAAGSVRFEGRGILGASPSELNRVRGSKLPVSFP